MTYKLIIHLLKKVFIPTKATTAENPTHSYHTADDSVLR